jgi:hypothetical protein
MCSTPPRHHQPQINGSNPPTTTTSGWGAPHTPLPTHPPTHTHTPTLQDAIRLSEGWFPAINMLHAAEQLYNPEKPKMPFTHTWFRSILAGCQALKPDVLVLCFTQFSGAAAIPKMLGHTHTKVHGCMCGWVVIHGYSCST